RPSNPCCEISAGGTTRDALHAPVRSARLWAPLHVFKYITFRTLVAGLVALSLSLFLGPAVIRRLIALQIGQSIRADRPPPRLRPRALPQRAAAIRLCAARRVARLPRRRGCPAARAAGPLWAAGGGRGGGGRGGGVWGGPGGGAGGAVGPPAGPRVDPLHSPP